MIYSEKKTVIKPKPQQKKRAPLSEEDVSNINFFLEDLQALDEEVEVADKVYDEIHTLYTSLTGGEYVPTRNLRDIAELAKNMISARTYHSDAVNKRIALKKTIADLNFRATGGVDATSDEAVINYARQIVNTVRQEALNDKSFTKNTEYKEPDKRTSEGKKRSKEENLLEDMIKTKLDSGEIKMGRNDKLVGKNDFIVSRYDMDSEKFVAVDSRNGEIIDDFPEDRLPTGKINKRGEDSVTLMNGDEVKLYNELEFDDSYEDNGD